MILFKAMLVHAFLSINCNKSDRFHAIYLRHFFKIKISDKIVKKFKKFKAFNLIKTANILENN